MINGTLRSQVDNIWNSFLYGIGHTSNQLDQFI